MKARKNFSFMFLFMIVLVLLVSACGGQSTPGTGATTKPSDLTVQQVLQKSSDAMKKLKSSHVEFKSDSSVQAVAAKNGTTSANKATPVATNVKISMNGSGDQAGVDQQQFNVTLQSAQQNLKLAEIAKGDKVYIQNAQGKWFVVSKSQMAKANTNLLPGMTLDQNSMLGLMQNVKLVDHGADNLNGQSLRHLTATLDKEALKQILTQNPSLKGSLGQQNIDEALANAKQFLTVVDVWIDEHNFYIHRTQLKMDIAANTSGVSKDAPGLVNTSTNTIVDLSKFDQPVTINVPANATPTDNPATVFGMAQ